MSSLNKNPWLAKLAYTYENQINESLRNIAFSFEEKNNLSTV